MNDVQEHCHGRDDVELIIPEMVTGVRRPVMAAVPNFLMVTGVVECSSSSSMLITGMMGLGCLE